MVKAVKTNADADLVKKLTKVTDLEAIVDGTQTTVGARYKLLIENIEQLDIKDGIIQDVRHIGTGCAICCSSASVMSETLKGKKVSVANEKHCK